MIEEKDIEKLAELARLEVSSSEKEAFRKEISSILEYVAEIKEASVFLEEKDEREMGDVFNVLREDDDPIPSGTDTEAILAEAPETKDGYFKVKKVL